MQLGSLISSMAARQDRDRWRDHLLVSGEQDVLTFPFRRVLRPEAEELVNLTVECLVPVDELVRHGGLRVEIRQGKVRLKLTGGQHPFPGRDDAPSRLRIDSG
jgi:hypothetical protein